MKQRESGPPHRTSGSKKCSGVSRRATSRGQFLDTGVELWADKKLRQLIFRLVGAKATCPALLATYWKSYGGPRWELFLAFLERMRVDGLLPESTDVEMLGNMIAGAMIFRLLFVPSRDELSRRRIRAYLERLMHQAGLADRRKAERK